MYQTNSPLKTAFNARLCSVITERSLHWLNYILDLMKKFRTILKPHSYPNVLAHISIEIMILVEQFQKTENIPIELLLR